MSTTRIRCPKCDWEPDNGCRWKCDVCNTVWNTFETHGRCPGCDKVFVDTNCARSRGGCGQMSPHADWYEEVETLDDDTPKIKSFWFWKNKNKLPITAADKQWIEADLVWLSELFEPVYFRSLETITPDKKYFDFDFKGTEDDAHFIFHKIASIMNVKTWEIQLMFYSEKSTRFSEGIVATPSEKLEGSWRISMGKYVDNGLGHKEIWIEEGQLGDLQSLIATIAHEMANFKLESEYNVEEKDIYMAGLIAIAFGFGIFTGNSYFKFQQWTGSTHQGWQMQKRGGLPEQLIAYAMAWLAHYRNEDIAWKQYLNKTMKKYFEKSYSYIEKNKDKVKWA